MTKVFLIVSVACNVWFLILLFYDLSLIHI